MKKSDLQVIVRECLFEVLNEMVPQTYAKGDKFKPEVDADGLVAVIEMDQWTSTGKYDHIPFDELTLDQIHGGDADAIKTLGIHSLNVKKVGAGESPRLGSVWLAKGPDGFPFMWQARYDSSG